MDRLLVLSSLWCLVYETKLQLFMNYLSSNWVLIPLSCSSGIDWLKSQQLLRKGWKETTCQLICVYVQVRGWSSRRCQHQHAGAQGAEGDHACDRDPDLLQLMEVLHMSLLWRQHRQADSECLGRADLRPDTEGRGSSWAHNFWSHFCSEPLSLSLLCSSSQSGYTLHCSFNLHLNETWLKSVCFSQFMSLSNKSASHWWEDIVTRVGSSPVYTHSNPGSTGLSPCFFLAHFDWSFELIVSTYHFSLWISRKKNHSQWYLCGKEVMDLHAHRSLFSYCVCKQHYLWSVYFIFFH